MKEHSISPRAMAENLWRYRHLFLPVIRREVLRRYRGSVLGLFRSFFNPLLMLGISTFVCGVIVQRAPYATYEPCVRHNTKKRLHGWAS